MLGNKKNQFFLIRNICGSNITKNNLKQIVNLSFKTIAMMPRTTKTIKQNL